MLVSHKTRSIFVHIQKTGGTSIERALRDADPDMGGNLYDGKRHVKAVDFVRSVPAQEWDQYFKFSFVRYPWDRLVSWYSRWTAKGSRSTYGRTPARSKIS